MNEKQMVFDQIMLIVSVEMLTKCKLMDFLKEAGVCMLCQRGLKMAGLHMPRINERLL